MRKPDSCPTDEAATKQNRVAFQAMVDIQWTYVIKNHAVQTLCFWHDCTVILCTQTRV